MRHPYRPLARSVAFLPGRTLFSSPQRGAESRRARSCYIKISRLAPSPLPPGDIVLQSHQSSPSSIFGHFGLLGHTSLLAALGLALAYNFPRGVRVCSGFPQPGQRARARGERTTHDRRQSTRKATTGRMLDGWTAHTPYPAPSHPDVNAGRPSEFPVTFERF